MLLFNNPVAHRVVDLRAFSGEEWSQAEGKQVVFDNLKKKLNLEEKYRSNFTHLNNTAHLPLKLLLYQDMLNLLQEIVVYRKRAAGLHPLCACRSYYLWSVRQRAPDQQWNRYPA